MSFEAEWSRCAPWLDAALTHAGRTHDVADVEAMVRAGEAQFWPGAQAAMVTTIENDPRDRRLVIWLAGGALSELVGGLRPRAEAWARRQRCRRVVLMGRPGWERTLKQIGYAPVARIIAKEL